MEAACNYCGNLIKYSPSNRRGRYCSNRCQGDEKMQLKLVNGSRFSNTISKYVKRVKGCKCESCGIENWQGKPITLHVDHIDGNRSNNTLENLRVLCPNCHSQTDTYGHRNVSEAGRDIMRSTLLKNLNRVVN